MSQRDHLDLLSHTRPLRLGLLVGEVPGVDWRRTWAGALSALGQVWGGSAAIPIPFGDAVDDELTWRIADVADPDWLGTYAPSMDDSFDVPADEAAAWQLTRDDAEQLMEASDFEAFLDDEGARPAVTVTPPTALVETLARRCGTFDTAESMLGRGPVTTGRVPYPMVDVTRFPALPAVRDPDFSDRPSVRLLQVAETGRLTPRLGRALIRAATPPTRLPRLTELTDVYGEPLPDLPGPWLLTELGCGWFRRGTIDRTHMTVVVGDRPDDFALAYLTRRCRARAWWLPSDLHAAEYPGIITALIRKARGWGHDILVTTLTDPAAADRVLVDLRAEGGNDIASTAEWRDLLARRPNRLLCRDVTPAVEAFPVRDGEIVQLPSPLPPVLPNPETELRWVVQTVPMEWVLHRDRHAAQAAVDGDWTSARSSDGGIAFTSPGDMVLHAAPLLLQVPRPRLRVLEVLDQLAAVAAAASWRVELSDKGSFAATTIDLFGGPVDAERSLTDPATAAVLVGYVDTANDVPGYKLNDGRRYLTLADAGTLRAGGGQALSALADLGIATRGVLLKCRRCRSLAFYRPRDIDPYFECVRCSDEQQPTSTAWIGSHEPSWFFRLDEAVTQFVNHRGELPLLAFMDRFSSSQDQTQVEVEVKLFDGDDNASEIDFVVVEGGRLWLGEGFTAARYKETASAENRRLGRLRTIAETLNAHGVQLHTAATPMDPRTVTAAELAFAGTSIKVETFSSARTLPRP